MTLGERISQCRKQAGLSQEALGEKVNVSRQAIYKWESDQAIPELDKLITLSKVFQVRIGWLVCEEEADQPEGPAEKREDAPPPEPDRSGITREELEAYLNRLRDMAAVKPKPKKWPAFVIAALSVALLVGLVQLRRMQDSYGRLEQNVLHMRSQMQQDINGISYQVQSVLESYNDLTLASEASIERMNFEDDTVTFRLSAQPKTYTEGMRVCYRADYGDGITEAEAEMQPDRSFTALLTCPMTDDIILNADFITGDTTESQLVWKYRDLRHNSFGFWYNVWPLDFTLRDGKFMDRYCEVHYHPDFYYGDGDEKLPTAEIASLEMALYEDDEKIAVYEQVDGVPPDMNYLKSDGSADVAVAVPVNGVTVVKIGDRKSDATIYFRYPTELEKLEPNCVYKEVLTVTDIYGRTLQVENY